MTSPSPQPQREAGARLERLLAILSWLAQRGQVPLTDLSEQFHLTAEQLVADLELAACCGLPPYTPDRLMEIIVGEESVEALLGAELGRPRRLSAQEGFALAASARASAAARGGDPDDALSRALSKLDAALGERGLAGEDFGVELGEPEHLGEVRDALSDGAELEIDYLSAWRDTRSDRVVDPLRLVAQGGHWYLDAWCHTAGGVRRFRLDRILGVSRSGNAAEHQGPDELETPESVVNRTRAGGAFVPGPEATTVRLAISADSTWMVESIPVLDTSPLPDGRIGVSLGVLSTVWLERLLLQLGPRAEVLEPEELKGLGREAAERVLEVYRS